MTIVTDTEGLTAGDVQITGGAHAIDAYHACPAGAEAMPVILVMHQIYGINDYSRDVCRRLAKAGFMAVLPDLYAGYGKPAGLTREEITAGLAQAVEDQRVLDTLQSSVAWAAARGGDPGRVGIMGFAWGAQYVWLACAKLQGCRAGVSWYGRLIRDPGPQRPAGWREVVTGLRAPVLGLYAGTDVHVTHEVLDEMRRGLEDAPVRTELAFYPEARHGFHADYQPQYRAVDAEDAWRRQMAWFRNAGLH